jgi:hypothetical protein
MFNNSFFRCAKKVFKSKTTYNTLVFLGVELTAILVPWSATSIIAVITSGLASCGYTVYLMAKNAEVKTQNYELASTNQQLRQIKIPNNIVAVLWERKFGLAPVHKDPLYLLLLLSTGFGITNTVLMFLLAKNSCECAEGYKPNVVMQSMASISGGLSALLWLPHHLWAAPNLRGYNIKLFIENTQLAALPDALLIRRTQNLEQEGQQLRQENTQLTQEVQQLRQENTQLKEEKVQLQLLIQSHRRQNSVIQETEEKQVLEPKSRYEGYCLLS